MLRYEWSIFGFKWELGVLIIGWFLYKMNNNGPPDALLGATVGHHTVLCCAREAFWKNAQKEAKYFQKTPKLFFFCCIVFL